MSIQDNRGNDYDFTLTNGDPTLPLVVCIHGYCQTGKETWSETIAALQRTGVRNQFLIIERKHGDRAGRITLGGQLQAVRNFVHGLIRHMVINREVIWMGHSLGGAIADDLAYTYKTYTKGVITLAQTSTTGYWILFNWSFWRNGGFISLPAVVKSVVTGHSVRFPMGMARGLFADQDCPPERFQQFFQTQRPDSALLFVQFLFAYFMPRRILLRLRELGQSKRKMMVGFTRDTLISPRSLHWLVWRTQTELIWLDSAHCWWLGSGIELVAHDLKQAIQRMSE